MRYLQQSRSIKHHLPGIISLGITLGIMLTNCSQFSFIEANQWEIYHNERFGFKFPYPHQWTPENPPSNRDGQVFSNPHEPQVKIRGWGGYLVSLSPPNSSPKSPPPPLKSNFKTHQGLPGELRVEIGTEISSMTLTLVQGNLQYVCQGEAPSRSFEDYYKFFYYVMSEYQVTPNKPQMKP